MSSSAGERRQSIALVGLSAVGLVCSVILLMEKLALLADPEHVPSCSINPVVACGSVITSWQASVVADLPNPVLGIVGFSIVMTAGALGAGGLHFSRGVWVGLLAGVLVGFAFVHWLIWQSLTVIGALCPYCMVVWVVMLALVTVAVRAGASEGAVPAAVSRWAPSAAVMWLALLVLAIFLRFQDYWLTLV